MTAREFEEREPMRLPAPEVPAATEGELKRTCDDARETLSPHETADCAGLGLVEKYENEEDGGS